MLHVEIRIQGQIAEHWSTWFEGLSVTQTEAGETVLSGELNDQSALYGVIARLRDLGLPLKSICSGPKPPSAQPT